MVAKREGDEAASSEPVLGDFNVARSSTADQVAKALDEALLRGDLVPGARVRESVIAAEVGVSRNTVREAVRILEQGGLVEHQVNRGAVVKPMRPEEVADLYRVRELLELNGIASLADGGDLGEVEAALEALAAAFQRGEVEEAVDRDLEFHASIVALFGSPRVDRFFRDLRRQLQFYLAVLSVADRETERPDELIEEHAAILRALQAGDHKKARALVSEHLRANAERLASLLEERQTPSAS